MIGVPVLLLLAISIVSGTGSRLYQVAEAGNRKRVDSIQELKTMLKSNEPFLIQFSKEGCPFCEVLNEQEDKYFETSSLVIYEYVLPWEEDAETDALLNSEFPQFKFVPALFYYDGLEVSDTIDVSDQGAFGATMNAWEGEHHGVL